VRVKICFDAAAFGFERSMDTVGAIGGPLGSRKITLLCYEKWAARKKQRALNLLQA
jgi:hypothetical protein